jgi:hypothetical protein
MTMTKLPALTRSRAVRAALRLLAAIWIAADAGAAVPQPAATLAEEHSAGAAVVAVFTGQFERGAPVYRLPSITIAAKRNVARFEAGAQKRVRSDPQSLPARETRAPS